MATKNASHKDQVKRLSRIEGQVRGIVKMIEEERYCVDVLVQMKAVRSALASVEKNILKNHINHCVQGAVKGKNTKKSQAMVEELQSLLERNFFK